MAYTKGDVQVITESSIRDEIGLDSDENLMTYAPTDARSEDCDCCCLPVILLPHSCQEWIIGGADEARQMIEDLIEAIKKLDAKSSVRVG